MGFFDKFFPKQEKRKEVKEKDLEVFLEKKISQVWQGTPRDFEPEKIRKSVQRVLEKVELLSNAEEEGEVHRKLAAISKSTRDNVCVVTMKEVQSISLNSLREFYVHAGRALKKIGNVTSKYDERVKIAYPSKYLELWKELRGLYSHYDKIESVAKGAMIKEKKFEEWLDFVKEHKNNKKELYALEGRAELLKRGLEEERSRLNVLDDEIVQFERGEEFAQYVSAKNNVEELRKEISKSKEEFESVIITLRKPFYYYKNQVVGAEEKKIVERIVDERGEFMNSKNSLENFNLVLAGLRNSVDSGRVELDEKRKETVLSILERGVDELFKNFEERVSQLEKERNRTKSSPAQERINKLKKENETVKQRISRQEDELLILKERLGDKKTALEKDRERILEIKSELEK